MKIHYIVEEHDPILLKWVPFIQWTSNTPILHQTEMSAKGEMKYVAKNYKGEFRVSKVTTEPL